MLINYFNHGCSLFWESVIWNPEYDSESLSRKWNNFFSQPRWKAECIHKGTDGLSVGVPWCFAAGLGIMPARNLWLYVPAPQHFFREERTVVSGTVRNSPTVTNNNNNQTSHWIACHSLSGRVLWLHFINIKNPLHWAGVSWQMFCVIKRKTERK